MTVYLVFSLPKIPYVHRIYAVYIWFWPTLDIYDMIYEMIYTRARHFEIHQLCVLCNVAHAQKVCVYVCVCCAMSRTRRRDRAQRKGDYFTLQLRVFELVCR